VCDKGEVSNLSPQTEPDSPLNMPTPAQLCASHRTARTSGQPSFGLDTDTPHCPGSTPPWHAPSRAALLALLSLPATVMATPLPWAATQSSYTVQIELLSGTLGGIRLPDPPSASGDAPSPLARAVADTVAVALSTAPSRESEAWQMQNPSRPSAAGHFATAAAQVVVRPAVPPASNDGDRATLAAITASHATHAESIFSGPVFARSAAASTAVWSAQFSASSAPGAQSGSVGVGDAIQFLWSFDELNLQTQSFNALAGMQHLVSVVQRTATDYRTDTLGFGLQVLNGVSSGHSWGSLPNSVAGWLDGLAGTASGATPPAAAGAGPWASLPLLAHDATSGSLQVTVELSHLEFSLEAPPVATRQVGAAAGSRSTLNAAASPQLHWDAPAGLLRLETMPISELIASGPNPPSSNDAALGGSIEIDPLVYLGELAGLRYFAGQHFRLRDRDGTVLLLGSIPTLVYDTAIQEQQGFNFFAPVMTVLEADLTRSAWLADFLVDMDFTTLQMPTIFIGMRTDSEPDWNHSFSRSAIGLFSFSGAPLPAGAGVAISAPDALMLMLLGLIYLGAAKRSARI
jgi:hypothetical protein